MKSVNLRLLMCTLVGVALLGGMGLYRIHMDTDIMEYLPRQDPVILDAGYFLTHHPVQNQIIMDISVSPSDPDALIQCSGFVEEKLRESGLFTQVGMGAVQAAFPVLVSHIVDHLPVLFTQEALHERVRPLLEPVRIRDRLQEIRLGLMGLENMGQAELISQDPLGLRNLVLARLSDLAPVEEMVLYKGRILSSDKKHLLLVATPRVSGTDTGFARKLTQTFNSLSDQLSTYARGLGYEAVLTPLGAYRAALDNEQMVREDVQRAILLATVGIALLLFLAFSRPLIGLFAFLPALAGTAAAFFVFSLFHSHMSIMVLGFGGAVISITVDHGIAYLLFLDRPQETSGKAASREIWGVGLFAALTTMGAFGALCISDFPMLNQLGQFTALGIGFSFLFVHTVFPLIFPRMPPGPSRRLALRWVTNRLSGFGRKGACAALVFALVMFFFARPHTEVGLSSMNTVSEETAAAEGLIGRVWGHSIFGKVHFIARSQSLEELQEKGDRVLRMVEADMGANRLSSGFVSSMVFPGKSRQQENFSAWRNFWTPQRRGVVTAALRRASADLGFSPGAFAPFIETLSRTTFPEDNPRIPDSLFNLLGVSQGSDGLWYQAASFVPGKAYVPEVMHQRYTAVGRLFDPSFFSQRLGSLLFATFMRMLIIIGCSVAVLLFLFFLDWRLTVMAFLPLLFALVSTLGTLNLTGHPLDIPGLMLSIVVLGMGVDYSLFLVRSYQRYGGDAHPGFGLIKTAVFMAAASTMIGFGVLCVAQHSLLRSAGFTSFLGIGYAMTGAFLILPPLLKAFFKGEGEVSNTTASLKGRVLKRYRKREAHPKVFAALKMKLDPMFMELPGLLEVPFEIRRIMDIGCGYGVPGCWFLERFDQAFLKGLDPDAERVRIASRVFGPRGTAEQGRAPQVPAFEYPADLCLMLDMVHFLSDEELALTLKRIYQGLGPGRRLIMRVAIPPQGDPSWLWRMEAVRRRLFRMEGHYRSLKRITRMVTLAGFQIGRAAPSGNNRESTWIIADTPYEAG